MVKDICQQMCIYSCIFLIRSKKLGPLWVYSCFYFEGQNGILKNLVHGTQKVDLQIMDSYSYLRHLPAIGNELMGTNYYEAFKSLHLQQKLPKKNCVKVRENIYLLGKELDHRDMSDGGTDTF